MESFFLAETTKISTCCSTLTTSSTTAGTLPPRWRPRASCAFDPAALHCCSGLGEKEIRNKIALEIVDILNPGKIKEFWGDLVPERCWKKRKDEAKA